jgi:hypothetical protein
MVYVRRTKSSCCDMHASMEYGPDQFWTSTGRTRCSGLSARPAPSSVLGDASPAAGADGVCGQWAGRWVDACLRKWHRLLGLIGPRRSEGGGASDPRCAGGTAAPGGFVTALPPSASPPRSPRRATGARAGETALDSAIVARGSDRPPPPDSRTARLGNPSYRAVAGGACRRRAERAI